MSNSVILTTKMKKVMGEKRSRTKSIILIALAAIIGVFLVKSFVASLQAPVEIDVITSVAYGPVELEGTLYKETPVGIDGPYLLVNEAGRIAELEISSNVDYLVGQPVKVTGELTPPKVDGGKQILIVSSISLIN